MATGEFVDKDLSRHATNERAFIAVEAGVLASVWAALGSLKLTVVLLSLLILLVFFGTLAQVHHDVWYVVREGYFRVFFAWVEWQTLPTLLGVFKPNNIRLEGGFYFPGGYLIGAAMVLNLIAAHSQRYKIVAKGHRLWAALGLLALGIGATWLVAARALYSGEQATISPQFADGLWNILRGALAGVALLGAYGLSLAWNRMRRPEWFALAIADALLLAAAAFLFLNPTWQINDSGMRIVWQLLQATAAGGLLMAAAWLLFGKRSGVVLLHVGIAILMGHEFYVGITNVEANMAIEEGETVNYAIDIRQTELAIINRTDNGIDHVTVVPEAMLKRAAAAPKGSAERTISHPELPVDLRVLDYYSNADIGTGAKGSGHEATLGSARTLVATQRSNVSGVKSELNIPAAYVELLRKDDGESLGTMLVSNLFDPYLTSRIPPFRLTQLGGIPIATGGEQRLDVDGTPIAVALRFERVYKSYEVTLLDFEHQKFMGTGIAKGYSSEIKLVDHDNDTELLAKTYMNNPLRYRGETFYQSGYNELTGTGTVLQVVKNESWMLPYIGCAVVVVGMLVHFGLTLMRFLDRRLREVNQAEATQKVPRKAWFRRPELVVPGVVAVLAAGYLASKFRSEEVFVDGLAAHEFATLPVLDEGRIKPIDTVARNTLQFFCSRQEAATSLDGKERVPAIEWLLDVVTQAPEARDYYVFRITNLELLETLGLERRPGFFRYSVGELGSKIELLSPQVQKADAVDEKQRTAFQRDVLSLATKMQLYSRLVDAYSIPKSIISNASAEGMEDDKNTFLRLRAANTVRGVVPSDVEGDWETLFEANVNALVERFEGRPPNPAAIGLATVVLAYRAGDEAGYLKALDEYRVLLASYQRQLEDPAKAELVSPLKTVERLDNDRVQFEYWFNSASPFYYCSALYLIAMVLAAAAWLGWPQVLGRSAIALIVVTFVVHTLAIAARVYISDRPPITNLYTTAICIGWAIVLFMLLFEAIFKLGIGSFVAGVVGFATLQIAHYLGLDEDTFTVMQAVLDTQFWLSTHVITINLGYATTMLAGCLGIVYIVAVHVLNVFNAKQARQLNAMIYGSLCFAILFSFVGTVLGGLWADDSWGRFWGWDPKENGALMIVLWNAVALHARWGKMVDARGLAMLAVFGNVITAWSWFGVNQLGEGLHAYAFRSDLAFYLWWFFVSQMVLLAIAWIPWRTKRQGAL